VKSINRLKREVKDVNLQMKEFGEIESAFSFPDQKEQEFFRRAERDFKRKIPAIRGQGDLTKLVSKVSGYFHNLAQQESIANLKINAQPGEPGIKVGDNLKYRKIYLRFSGDLKNALYFINHLPYCDVYLTAADISLAKENTALVFTVAVKIYYSPGKTPVSGSPGGIDLGSGLEIDSDSEFLLERVYRNSPKKYRKKELPPEFGSLPVL
jgi:hypothetical protein